MSARTYVTRGGEVREVPVATPRPRKRLGDESATAARTRRNNELLAAGIHPATRRPLRDGDAHCGTCVHHHAHEHYTTRRKVWHKCGLHRLGQSHSEASDIRVSWPACEWYERSEA